MNRTSVVLELLAGDGQGAEVAVQRVCRPTGQGVSQAGRGGEGSVNRMDSWTSRAPGSSLRVCLHQLSPREGSERGPKEPGE